MLAAVLIVVLGLLVAADRIAVRTAEGRIADKLAGKRPFLGRPSVSIDGFPFLTQALDGTYDDIEVSGEGVPVGKLSQVHVDAHLRGVHLSLSDATGGVSQVPVDHADVSMSVSLSALAAASGIDGLTLTASGDQITAQGPVTLPGLGTVTVSATGRLVIDGAGDITADLTSLHGVGVVLPSSAHAAALSALDLTVAVDDLPFRSAATSVRVRPGSVVVSATARDLVLQ